MLLYRFKILFYNSKFSKILLECVKWRPPSLSELTTFMFYMELAHLVLEAIILYLTRPNSKIEL